MVFTKSIGIALLPLCLLATGCGESATVELHEPGEYSGKPDPLLQIAGTPAQDKQLRDRVMQIQTDR